MNIFIHLSTKCGAYFPLICSNLWESLIIKIPQTKKPEILLFSWKIISSVQQKYASSTYIKNDSQTHRQGSPRRSSKRNENPGNLASGTGETSVILPGVPFKLSNFKN